MNKKYAACIIAAALVLTTGYLTYENEALMLTEYIYSSPKVTPELDSLKICHLSDIHNKRFGKNNARLVKLVAGQSPDIIVISGDLVDSRRTDVDAAIELIEQLALIAPVYYSTGNHEERLKPQVYVNLMEELSTLGVHILDLSSETFEYNGGGINIAGLFDSGYFSADDAKELLKDGVLNILINHRPQFAADYALAGFDIAFSGHAHGGQWRLPFVGGLIAPDQWFFPKYSEGVHTFGSRSTVISRGIGNSLMPFRVNNRPEVIIVTLKSQ